MNSCVANKNTTVPIDFFLLAASIFLSAGGPLVEESVHGPAPQPGIYSGYQHHTLHAGERIIVKTLICLTVSNLLAVF
jgi:hypothetical protein